MFVVDFAYNLLMTMFRKDQDRSLMWLAALIFTMMVFIPILVAIIVAMIYGVGWVSLVLVSLACVISLSGKSVLNVAYRFIIRRYVG